MLGADVKIQTERGVVAVRDLRPGDITYDATQKPVKILAVFPPHPRDDVVRITTKHYDFKKPDIEIDVASTYRMRCLVARSGPFLNTKTTIAWHRYCKNAARPLRRQARDILENTKLMNLTDIKVECKIEELVVDPELEDLKKDIINEAKIDQGLSANNPSGLPLDLDEVEDWADIWKHFGPEAQSKLTKKALEEPKCDCGFIKGASLSLDNTAELSLACRVLRSLRHCHRIDPHIACRGDIIDFDVRTLLQDQHKQRRLLHLERRAPIRDTRDPLPDEKSNMPIPAVWYGLWLGDGSAHAPMIASNREDQQTHDYICSIVEDYNTTLGPNDERLRLKVKDHSPNKSVGCWWISCVTPGKGRNHFQNGLRSLGVLGDKSPGFGRALDIGTLVDHLEILIGLIISDGWTSPYCVRIVQQGNGHKKIIMDAYEVALRLGLRASIREGQSPPRPKLAVFQDEDGQAVFKDGEKLHPTWWLTLSGPGLELVNRACFLTRKRVPTNINRNLTDSKYFYKVQQLEEKHECCIVVVEGGVMQHESGTLLNGAPESFAIGAPVVSEVV